MSGIEVALFNARFDSQQPSQTYVESEQLLPGRVPVRAPITGVVVVFLLFSALFFLATVTMYPINQVRRGLHIAVYLGSAPCGLFFYVCLRVRI